MFLAGIALPGPADLDAARPGPRPVVTEGAVVNRRPVIDHCDPPRRPGLVDQSPDASVDQRWVFVVKRHVHGHLKLVQMTLLGCGDDPRTVTPGQQPLDRGEGEPPRPGDP